MSSDSPQPEDRIHARVVELETLYTHLQQTVAALDQVVLEQQARIELLERTISALGHELGTLAGSIRDERKPEDEKPPHY